MTTLILDKSKWICGGGLVDGEPSKNALGTGDTWLENFSGYMCCLGQFAMQVDPSLIDLCGITYPRNIDVDVKGLCYHIDGKGFNTVFSDKAAAINDNLDTTIETKIELLTKLCKAHKIELRVI